MKEISEESRERKKQGKRGMKIIRRGEKEEKDKEKNITEGNYPGKDGRREEGR